MKIKNLKIEKLLPNLKKNVLLKDYTTFKIGGKAKYFLLTKTNQDLINAIKIAKSLNIPFFVLGKGSNLLISEKGFNGLIIKIENSKIKIRKKSKKIEFFCQAGVPLTKLVSYTAKNSASGLEWAAGIPGTVGGAIWGNAGAFNNSIANLVKSVKVLNTQNLKIVSFNPKKCRFSYRYSIFKSKKNLIILSAIFQLKKGNKKEVEKKIKEYLCYRKTHHPLNLPSVGSIFKNVKINKIKNWQLLKKFPEIEKFKKSGEIPAGWLIEKSNLKGKKIGGAKISEIHANFIVNQKEAKASDVKKIIELVKKRVKEKFAIALTEEISYL